MDLTHKIYFYNAPLIVSNRKLIFKKLGGNMKKLLIVVLALSMVLALFAGCAKTEDADMTDTTQDQTTDDTQDDTAAAAGEVTVSGSTSVEPVGIALGDEFMALNPDVKFTYQGIGSSAGVTNANDGVTMLGTASREIKDSEKEYGMTEVVLAYDGIAVIANTANAAVSDLTVEQVQKIYLGEIKNWNQVGGDDQSIVVVSREAGSGTRGAFEEIVGFEDMLVASATIAEGNGAVKETVVGNPYAIGYVSFTYVDDTVKPMLIEGAEPTVDNVLSGTYPVSRPFMIVYHEDNLSDAAKDFLDFITTDKAKEIIAEEGAIPLADASSDDTEEVSVSGEVTVSGSTSVEPVGIALGDEFMAINPDVKFTYQGIGSSAGVTNANDGVTMLGTASREIKDSEKEYGMTEVELAYDGIAVIANTANAAVSDLTVEQVQKIYLGEIKNWKEVGGDDQAIVVVSREAGSGTRGAFEEIVGFEDMLVASATIAEGNGAVKETVVGNPYAIGYVSFTYVDNTVKPMLIEGAEPTVDNVLSGTYPVSRPFMIVYHEENLSDAAKAFLDFITTDTAKDIIAEEGAIPLN